MVAVRSEIDSRIAMVSFGRPSDTNCGISRSRRRQRLIGLLYLGLLAALELGKHLRGDMGSNLASPWQLPARS